MTDDYAKWRALLAGEKVPLHLDEPICGYFRMRDRRGYELKSLPKPRPYIACAIWRDPDGTLKAERAKAPVPVEWIWPYCAKGPISYEDYAHWHQHERWPEEAKVA